MIVVFCGHSQSGKTTMCKMFHTYLKANTRFKKIHYIDADKLIYVFEKLGRKVKNDPVELHALGSDIAIYEKSINEIVLMALPFDRPEFRSRIDSSNTLWIWLDASNSARRSNDVPLIPPYCDVISTGDESDHEQSLKEVVRSFDKFMINAIYVKK